MTGWAIARSQNPHHRFWCPPGQPEVPGAAAGRRCRAARTRDSRTPTCSRPGSPGCAPQKCFLDNGEAWSANEVTINWNAPLSWVAAYLDEREAPKPAPKAKKAK